MVKEYLKKLRDNLTEEIKRSGERMLFQMSEKARYDVAMDKMITNARHNNEICAYTKDDIIRMTNQLTVFLPSKAELIEKINNTPSIAPFSMMSLEILY